jgi:malto-oligosyltrehalose trehalohydrolase
MVFLDVVYNHFGPEGNYLHLYASPFFTDRYNTPWGEAIRFSGAQARWVRRFFIDNALYWLEEYHFDGLRLDAVHAIFDPSDPSFLEELAAEVRNGPGRKRQIHLVLENYDNESRLLARNGADTPRYYSAQWNDDIHHAAHILLTGETDGYYTDYAGKPVAHLGRCLTEGFAYQGEESKWRKGRKRGTPSGFLPPTAFVNFIQNHDQIGNRAFGERLSILADDRPLKTATAILLLAPQPPLLFMGQEWGCRQPFLYFCDFGDDLAPKVRDGRRREFAGFAAFTNEKQLERIPDPCDWNTFARCILDRSVLDEEGARQWLAFHRRLLELRRCEIIPRLGCESVPGSYRELVEKALAVEWQLPGGELLQMIANLGGAVLSLALPRGRFFYLSEGVDTDGGLEMESWSVAFYLQEQTSGTTAGGMKEGNNHG